MAISARCPSCAAAFALDDNLAGANIRCKACQAIFQAPQTPTVVPLIVEEEPITLKAVQERPAAVGPPLAKHTLERSDVPRRRRTAPAKDSTGLVLLIVGGVAVCLMLGVGILVVGVVLFWQSSPKPANQVQGSSIPNIAGPGQAPAKGKGFNAPGEPAKTIPGDMFTFIQQSVKEKRLSDVDIRGFRVGKDYRETPEMGAILFGFQVGYGKFANQVVIDSLQPIYLTKNGEHMGQWYGRPPANPTIVKARPGYVVSAVSTRTGLQIAGFSLKFAKLGQGRLQMEDNYQSEWIGGNSGGAPSMIGGQGAIFVGVCGHLNDQGVPCSLGLIAVLSPRE